MSHRAALERGLADWSHDCGVLTSNASCGKQQCADVPLRQSELPGMVGRLLVGTYLGVCDAYQKNEPGEPGSRLRVRGAWIRRANH